MAQAFCGMKFSALIEQSNAAVVARGGSDDPVVFDLAYDSRKVVPGTVFAAIPGTKVQGDAFIQEAINKGAAAVISENPHPELVVPWVQTKEIRTLLGRLGRTLWHVNDKAMIVAGVTGTNGKTTVAHLFEALFTSIYSAAKVWMFGTIGFHLGERRAEAMNTTPESLDIFRHIGTASEPPSALVMEVSSHSLSLDRIGGLSFDLAVFTNLTQDHLDFHGDMESYYRAKRKLFTDYLNRNGCASINIDDPYGRRLLDYLGGKRCVTYGMDQAADVRITNCKCDWDGCRIETKIGENTVIFSSKLRGFFNVHNMAALIAGATCLGYTAETVQKAFDLVPFVNGRMERVETDLPFSVVIDYAHTPDALDNVLRTAGEITRGRLLCVFGCGGDRDRKKRPLMGAAVAAHCDEAWVTSDNPRSEQPARIIDEIVEGIPLDFPFQVQPDRREAIRAALHACRTGDCLVIAGKGHETYQEVNGVRYHFDDKEVVAEICREMREKGGKHAR